MAGVFYFPLVGTPTAEGNQLSFFSAGTDSPLDVWTDSSLTIPWAQPITLNATGNSDGPIYVSASPAYKVVYTDANGVAVPGYPVDFVSPSTITNIMTTQITTLTDAQIKALPTTGITVLTAPSSSTVRARIHDVSYSATTSAGAYTNINTTYADFTITMAGQSIAYGPINDSTVTPHLVGVTQLLGSAAHRLYDVPSPHVEAIPAAAALQYVQEVQNFNSTQAASAGTLTMNNNGSGNLTGGNAANTLLVTIYYTLESV